MTTVEEFLRPPPEELDHVVLVKTSGHVQKKYDSANISERVQKNRDTDNSRFPPLADERGKWSDFDVESISSHPSIAACLSQPCVVMWEPQVPKFARVVYSERQLEALFLQTLITRVNIALDKAIPQEEDRIAIVVGPGAFESVSAEGSVGRLLPDWIVVQGSFDINMEADLLPVLKALAKEGRILAVGDTKLVRQRGGHSGIDHTRACHYDFLRQLQEYCLNLYTRFGFILSNEELVVVQIMAAEESSPRGADQRDLRSNGGHQLEPGLDSQGTDSFDSMDQDDDYAPVSGHNGGGEDDPSSSSPSAQRPPKRPHSSTGPETSPNAADSKKYRYANRSLSGIDINYQMPSDPPAMEAVQMSSSQDHSKYAPSDRDVEVGAIQVRSFDMMVWGEESKESPYRALFMFVMMVRALRLQGQSILIKQQQE